MQRILSIALAASFLFGCNSQNNSDNTETMQADSTKTVQAEGWINLFDGQTTKGWHKYGGGSVGSAW